MRDTPLFLFLLDILTSPDWRVTLFVMKPHLFRSCCCWAAIFSSAADTFGAEEEERRRIGCIEPARRQTLGSRYAQKSAQME